MSKPEQKTIGRPVGTVKADKDRRVSLTLRVIPAVADNIRKLPKGFLRKLLEHLFSG